jgi:antitoxin component of RelBE/YafQ-DinJ toxin-antitoxin module
VYYAETFADDLLERKERASAALAKLGVTPSEIVAVAHRYRATAVIYHEDRIAELERRRRALQSDYAALQARRPATVAIEDAVVVR